ncbi:hypothetical protein QM797_02335 [Rhodococcus sp. IEGM 1381]|uniref:hypothetical protein n=1 Tax=Rhodococcus sp. IEGM 1381 TaxID=3047085 RepID=UPI0024B6C1A2|nr:hypothetical protein [Rhodococcus sp. IEGM 1381]MDI9893552.1 hypothetical protein [Rhodococcus sp. IEGM 1381]
MSTADLTQNEILVLLVLMSEDRVVKNADLKNFGPVLDAGSRAKLVKLGLIESAKPNRFIELTLTAKGWEYCTNLFVADAPDGSNPATRVLFTLLRGVERFLEPRGLVAAQLFGRTSIEKRIRAAYEALASRPGAWVGLRLLREALSDVGRESLDTALVELQQHEGVSLIPEENQKTLTDEDRLAAVLVGTQLTHLLAIEPTR